MANRILLEVVTPDRLVLSTEADVVVCPGVEGQFGVLFGHVPFLSALEIGEMYYKDGGKTEYLAVSGGFAEVTGTKVTVVAEAAESGREIDIERAKRALERAEKRLALARTEAIDWARAEAALRRSIVRMKVAGR
jgi:F-type H+-transporting ATPase subunit epsilon